MSFEYFIGTRYLKAKQKQAFISMITVLSVAGVAVGVMALIVVIAVMSGFEDDLKSRILGVESHLVLMRHGGSFSGYQAAMEKMEAVEGEFPVVLKDETDSYWNIFGEAVSGERGGEKLPSPVYYTAARWAWLDLYENVTYFD